MAIPTTHDDITFFGRTNFRNREVPFGIKKDDRRRHMYIIGKTGMGKTTLMEHMVIQDIRNGHGVCFIDPHGDSVAKILDYVPSNRVNDVIYFNPADLEFPIAFNILEAVDTKYKHLVASGLMGVFTKIWANMWSARMEYILNNTILALLESPGNTMLGIVRMYVDKKYRKKIVDNVKDPMVRAFWIDEFANYAEKYRTEAVAPIQNKVGQFLSSSIIRNIVGQPRSTIDLRQIMDEKKILLLDLSKGKVGEDNSALLGAMIITKLQLAALSRVDILEKDRQDFYLYVDEFQNFVTESFATILSEARKYRLNLTIGHQYIGQLTPDRNSTKVRDAVFGNVGSMICFRVGAADAEFLETEFAPLYTPNDIVNLPKYNILLKLMINGVSSDPFSAVTLPVDDTWVTGNAEKVIKVSRERYSNNIDDVEEKISRWMGAEFHEQQAVVMGQGGRVKEDADEADQLESATSASPLPNELSGAAQDSSAQNKSGVGKIVMPIREQREVAGDPYQFQKQPPQAQPAQRAHQGQYTERRFEDRRQSPGSRSMGSQQQARSRYVRPQTATQPKEDPIWEKARNLQEEKAKTFAEKLEEGLQASFIPKQDIGSDDDF